MIVQLPGIQPEIAIRPSRRRTRVGAAGAAGVVPPAAAEHRDRQLVQPAAGAQERACCRATSIRRGWWAT
jgi:hypothetical protein